MCIRFNETDVNCFKKLSFGSIPMWKVLYDFLKNNHLLNSERTTNAIKIGVKGQIRQTRHKAERRQGLYIS